LGNGIQRVLLPSSVLTVGVLEEVAVVI
jgi:hypothetical protein